MSNPGTPNKSSVGLSGQQGGGSQAGSSGSTSQTGASGSGSGAGASGSSSSTSGSNGQSSSVGVIAGAHDQAAAGPVVGGGTMVDLNRSIRTPKPYYPKKDGDFKTWVRHLEHYFTLLNIGDARKTTVLLYYLGDEASNTAFHLNITDATN